MTYVEKHQGISDAIMAGRTNERIASEFGISRGMVQKHRSGVKCRSTGKSWSYCVKRRFSVRIAGAGRFTVVVIVAVETSGESSTSNFRTEVNVRCAEKHVVTLTVWTTVII